jgi:hypothetical protein
MLDFSRTGLTDDGVYHLQLHIQRFPCLKHLYLSRNPSIRFVPYSFMRFVQESRISLCDVAGWAPTTYDRIVLGKGGLISKKTTPGNCSLVLPSINVIEAAAEKRLIELLLFLNSSELSLSGANVSLLDVDIVAQWLPNFSSLTLLDISDNPLLGDAGVACILSAITGACTCCS